MKDFIKTYKVALIFIGKFVAFYLVLNLLYGLYVNAQLPRADVFTTVATVHTNAVLHLFGYDTNIYPQPTKPNVAIQHPEYGTVLSVYEGCNGINVMIVFLAFLFAFKWSRSMLWFVPLGLLLIHLANIVRILLLFIVSIDLPDFLYFSHKYLFTASIFFVVFALWYWWVKRVSSSKS